MIVRLPDPDEISWSDFYPWLFGTIAPLVLDREEISMNMSDNDYYSSRQYAKAVIYAYALTRKKAPCQTDVKLFTEYMIKNIHDSIELETLPVH